MTIPAKHKLELEETIQKANVLNEALPYIQRFRGQSIVIKYGGHAMIDNMLKAQVARDLVLLESVGINPVVIHGGGPEITRLSKRMGIESTFRDGQRVTDEATLEITEMVLAGKLNGEIVSGIQNAGGRAVGLSGRDGNMILARKLQSESGADMGFVGEVTEINTELIDMLTKNQFIPVISPIGVDEAGQIYNINADFVAAEIAAALKASMLILLTDVRGVLRDPKDETTLIPHIKLHEIDDYIKQGILSGGMIPKIKGCLAAFRGGVQKVHILDGRLPHALLLEIFTDSGIGTMIE